MRDWMDVAVLAKTRNLKGRLVVHCTAGLPLLLEEGVEVAFVPPQTDVVRRARVAAVHEVDGHSAEVEFEGVDGAAAAELVGCHCLIRRRGIPPEAFEEQPALWDGWTVVDADEGLVGTVTDVIDNPGQVLLALDRADGKGELLVPAVDDIVLDVDVDACEVRVALPKGLLDL